MSIVALLWWVAMLAVLCTLLVMLRTVVRPWIYDVMIVRMTTTWYREFLTRVPRGTRVLVSAPNLVVHVRSDVRRRMSASAPVLH